MIVPAEETAQRSDEIELYGFAEKKHGLVTFASDGRLVATMPGHSFGKAEIEVAVKAALSAP